MKMILHCSMMLHPCIAFLIYQDPAEAEWKESLLIKIRPRVNNQNLLSKYIKSAVNQLKLKFLLSIHILI